MNFCTAQSWKSPYRYPVASSHPSEHIKGSGRLLPEQVHRLLPVAHMGDNRARVLQKRPLS